MGRLDHQIRPMTMVTARYYINDTNTNTTGTYGHPGGRPDGDITDVRVQSILVARHAHFQSDARERSAVHLPAAASSSIRGPETETILPRRSV